MTLLNLSLGWSSRRQTDVNNINKNNWLNWINSRKITVVYTFCSFWSQFFCFFKCKAMLNSQKFGANDCKHGYELTNKWPFPNHVTSFIWTKSSVVAISTLRSFFSFLLFFGACSSTKKVNTTKKNEPLVKRQYIFFQVKSTLIHFFKSGLAGFFFSYKKISFSVNLKKMCELDKNKHPRLSEFLWSPIAFEMPTSNNDICGLGIDLYIENIRKVRTYANEWMGSKSNNDDVGHFVSKVINYANFSGLCFLVHIYSVQQANYIFCSNCAAKNSYLFQ